ncbi:MAG: cupin domain-containing protein [Alphaproteobacteria bacterium]
MALNREQVLQDNYEALLLAYAAGMLDEAQRLIVGAHLMLAPEARRMVHLCEALGGALINSCCKPVQMHKHSLDNVMARLGEEERKQPKPRPQMEIPEEFAFLAPLLGLTACRTKPVHWQRTQRGIEKYELPIHCESHAQCIKAAPAVEMPHDSHSDVEITLVIQGSMDNDCGHYRRGDLVVMDRAVSYTQRACPNTGGIYMIVSSTGTCGHALGHWLDRLFR